MSSAIEELEQIYGSRQYLTAAHRQQLEEPALEELPRQEGFADSARLQTLMARVLLGRVGYGESSRVGEWLNQFSSLPLYAEHVELQRLHAQALAAACGREVELYRQKQAGIDQALHRARAIAQLPLYAQDQAIRESQAAALSACSQAVTARSRRRDYDQYECAAQAERISEELPMIPGFNESLAMQFEYACAVLELVQAWRYATPGRQSLQNITKARGLSAKVRALSQLEQPGGEDMLTRWVPELTRLEADFPTRLPQHPGFAASGPLQNHYSTYLSTEAAKPETSAAQALEMAEKIRPLPLYGQWPTIAQCYCLALGSVIAKMGDEDLALLEKATRRLEEATPNPAPALKGWDALVALAPDHAGYQEGRRQWLERHGFGPEATLSEVVRRRLQGV